ALSRTAENGGLIMMHAENGGAIDVLVKRYLAEGKGDPINHGLTRPASMEGEATGRAIALARLAEVAVYIVHLSSKEALDAVREARDDGAPTFAETCPQYLYLSLDDLARPGFEGAKYVCSPPLRPKQHHDELWKGLLQDDLQLVATDHCPFHFKGQKDLGRGDFSKIPNGLPGVEDRFTLIFHGGVNSGRITLNRFVELVATAPAKMFGLFPRKGTIAPGSDADIVVFNPNLERTLSAKSHHMNVDYSCYEGMTVRGLPEVVIQRGTVLVRDGQFHGRKAAGRFPGAFPLQGALRPAPRGAVRDRDRGERQDPRGVARRGQAGDRGHRFRLRRSHLDDGTEPGPDRQGDRRGADPLSGRRGGGHHALQLPQHGAALDDSGGPGLRQYLRPQALPAHPPQRHPDRGAAAGGGTAGGRLQRRPRRQ